MNNFSKKAILLTIGLSVFTSFRTTNSNGGEKHPSGKFQQTVIPAPLGDILDDLTEINKILDEYKTAD